MGYFDKVVNQGQRAASDPLREVRRQSGQVSKGYTGMRDDMTGRKKADDLRKEQKSMFGQLGHQEEAMYGAETAHLNRMKDPALGIESDAKSRMTLAQSQDPNNPVASAFRQFYDQQAEGEGKRGLADVGVMQALGAQAMQGQMGGGTPLSTGQMQAMMSQNQNQSGQAFSNVQKRMQGLRDQGVAQGWLQTNQAYERGQGALDRYSGLSGMEADIGTGHAQRRSALISGKSAAYQQMLAQQAQAKAAQMSALTQSTARAMDPFGAAGGQVAASNVGMVPATSVTKG